METARQLDALVTQLPRPSLLADALSRFDAVAFSASLFADRDVAEGAGVVGLVPAVAAERALARAVEAARHDQALVARHAVPAHRACADVGAHALAVLGARFGDVTVVRGRFERADRRAAEVLGLRPA